MATGANTAPLGRLHPILAAKGIDQTSNSGTVSGSKDPELKKHLEAAKRAASALFPSSSSEPPKKKKRKSRWNTDDGKIVISGLPTVLPGNMTEEEQAFYIMHLKIEEHSRMLRTGDLGIPVNPGDRSPSPEPIYNHDGKRQNTREVRMRKKLEDERHDMVQKAMALKPEYKSPSDYKPPNRKFEDKVFIPQDHHPETNFVGLLIGPRGNTLKQLERETQTKIMIRGKGATKEGKLGRAGLPQPGEDEPLHALITGTTPELVKGAVDKIKSIIQSGIDVPGNDNDLKKLQLQQLAELNGTFKPLDVLKCRNCGSTQHKTWECSEQQNITSSIVCTKCGGGGHIASDCKAEIAPAAAPVDKAKMDSEYMSLMKELGESVPEAPVSRTAVPPPANLTAGKSGDRHFQPPPPTMGMVSIITPPWAQHVGSGAPPLIPGPPPHFMMMAPAGGLMGTVPHWGMAAPHSHCAPAPLMPTPHMAVPLTAPVSYGSSEAAMSLSGPGQPVPLLSVSVSSSSAVMNPRPAVPLATPTQPTQSAAQPRPPSGQPPWQQQPQQPPQPPGPHPLGPHPLGPHGQHPPGPHGQHPPGSQPSHPQQQQQHGRPPPPSHPHPQSLLPQGPQPMQPPQPQALRQPPPPASQAPPLLASQAPPLHAQHASQAPPQHVQPPLPHASQAPGPHASQAPPFHASQALPLHAQPQSLPPPHASQQQPPPWQHAPPPPMMYGAPHPPLPHGMPPLPAGGSGNAPPPPPPDQSWPGAPPPAPPPS